MLWQNLKQGKEDREKQRERMLFYEVTRDHAKGIEHMKRDWMGVKSKSHRYMEGGHYRLRKQQRQKS